jgi:short-subunit dehydrogenase
MSDNMTSIEEVNDSMEETQIEHEFEIEEDSSPKKENSSSERIMHVLITGASSGIGRELAKIFAKNGYNVLIVARRKDLLIELKEEITSRFNVDVNIIVSDLSRPAMANKVYEGVKTLGIRLDVLVNNAGFGEYGNFKDASLERTEDMINLNILALTKLTRLFMNDIIESKGAILNVASTAAFMPGPLMSVYFATKSYVLSFSEAIAEELKDDGVTVTALCPGPTISGFQEAANLKGVKFVEGKNIPTSKEVAEYGYNALIREKRVAIYGASNKLMAHAVKFIPRKTVAKMVKNFQKKKDD